jgi:hypothetical protein
MTVSKPTIMGEGGRLLVVGIEPALEVGLAVPEMMEKAVFSPTINGAELLSGMKLVEMSEGVPEGKAADAVSDGMVGGNDTTTVADFESGFSTAGNIAGDCVPLGDTSGITLLGVDGGRAALNMFELCVSIDGLGADMGTGSTICVDMITCTDTESVGDVRPKSDGVIDGSGIIDGNDDDSVGSSVDELDCTGAWF